MRRALLLLALLAGVSPAFGAALNGTLVWEVRTAGSDTLNSGCFDPGVSSPGTDYSVNNSVQFSGSNLVIDATVNTKVTSATHNFVAADVGNCIQITAGIGYTTGFYEILSVASNAATLNASPGAVGLTGGTWAEGGALVSPGKAGSAMVGGNTLHIKSGTYSITSATANVASGCLTLPAGSATALTRIIGYGTTRNDNGTQPLLQAGNAISSFAIITTAADNEIENLSLDGANLTTSRGINAGTGPANITRVKVVNCKNNAILGTGSVKVQFCEATGNSSISAFSSGLYFYCTSHDNTVNGFALGSGHMCVGCISANNTGSTSDGFNIVSGATGSQFINCTSYANGRSGFNFSTVNTGFVSVFNCIAMNNVIYGYTAATAADNVYLFNCAGITTGTGNIGPNLTAGNSVGFVTLTADPFRTKASNDFGLNNVSGGGKSLRWAGVASASGTYALPGLSSTPFWDIGAVPHKDRIRGWFGGQR